MVRAAARSIAAAALFRCGGGGQRRFPAAQFVTLSADAGRADRAPHHLRHRRERRRGRLVALALPGGSSSTTAAGLAPWDPRLAWARGPAQDTSLLVGLSDGLVRSADFCNASRL